jgi:hypothetical protein
MSRLQMLRAGSLCALLAPLGGVALADEYSFDASAFEKKPLEMDGYVEFKQEEFRFNRSGIFYQLNNSGLPQRETLDRSTATMQLNGKLRYGIATFDFRTNSLQQHDQTANGHGNSIYEAAWSIRPDPGATVEMGKRSLKWGKGYAWNPIAFVERPKDPNDPQLAREGFMLADGDLIINRAGALQTVALTPVLLPTTGGLNKDFGPSGHLNPAARLYLLYRDTDIDLAWQGKGSRPARFGFDFSRNLATNIELHGEWARIRQFSQAVSDNSGRITARIGDATGYLLGLRYLTENETTYIAEYYHNGSGYTDQELDQFYQLAGAAYQQLQQTGHDALWQRVQSLSQGSYGRPNTARNYAYIRAQVKDAFGIVYFQPAITAMFNLNDHSYQITPELQYTGINNFDLRARLFVLGGGHFTDFGEKQNSRKLELSARFYF